MQRDLVVDVGVLMSASGLGAYVFHDASLRLAEHIGECPSCFLAIDERGRIRQQYLEKMRLGTLGYALVMRLASDNRLILVPVRPIPRGVRVKLQEAHFDPEDGKYVQTAAQTKCRMLISHDDDYTPAVRRILREIDVEVRDAGLTVSTCQHGVEPVQN